MRRRITATLEIRKRVEGGADRYGNPVVTYISEAWPVFALAPRSSTEPDEGNRDVVITGVTVFAPIGGPRPGPHDLVVHAGGEWRVVGEVGVWDNNPHVPVTTERGIVVNLERSTG